MFVFFPGTFLINIFDKNQPSRRFSSDDKVSWQRMLSKVLMSLITVLRFMKSLSIYVFVYGLAKPKLLNLS